MTDTRNRGAQTPLQGIQVECAPPLMNLHGIASAHGDVRLGLTRQMGKFVAHANAAIRIALRLKGLDSAAPNVTRKKPPVECRTAAGQKLDAFSDLK